MGLHELGERRLAKDALAVVNAAVAHELAEHGPVLRAHAAAARKVGVARLVAQEAWVDAERCEHLAGEVGDHIRVARLRGRELALHQFAEDIELARPVDEALAGRGEGLRVDRGRGTVGDARRARVARVLDRAAERFDSAGEREQLPHRHLRLARVGLPFVNRVGHPLVEREEAVFDRKRRGDAAEALGAAREEMRRVDGQAGDRVVEHGLAVEQDEQHFAVVLAGVLGGRPATRKEGIGGRRLRGRRGRRLGKCEDDGLLRRGPA